MRGRSGLAAILAGTALAGVAACSGSGAEVFHPSGSPPAAQTDTLRTAVTTAPGGYHFPPGVHVGFSTPPPGSATRRAMVTGYENYVLALWAAVLSHGKDAAYQKLTAENALAFVRREVSYFTSHHGRIQGTIRYSGAKVGATYFRTGATVTACVDTSGFRVTGSAAGPVFPPRYARYLEDVALAKRADGTWYVIHTESFPASTSQGAMCR
jgi:hypothetical protein